MEKVGAYTDRVTDEGEWRSGNPASGQQATPMLAEYFNMLQREVVAVVEDDGTALDKANNGQLVAAIKRIVGKLFGERIATQAEVNAGIRDDVVVTPKKMRWGVSMLIGSTGYLALPSWLGGIIVQWGSVAGAATYTVTLPLAMPSVCCAAVANPDTSISSAPADLSICCTQVLSNSQFTIACGRVSAGAVSLFPRAVRWIAVGF